MFAFAYLSCISPARLCRRDAGEMQEISAASLRSAGEMQEISQNRIQQLIREAMSASLCAAAEMQRISPKDETQSRASRLYTQIYTLKYIHSNIRQTESL
jgi:hypothetical protein